MLINILQILACYWNMPNTCLRTKILQKCNGDMNSNLIKSCKFLFYQMRKILQFTESFVVPNSAARRPPRRAAHRAARPRAPVHVLKLHGRRAEAVPGRRHRRHRLPSVCTGVVSRRTVQDRVAVLATHHVDEVAKRNCNMPKNCVLSEMQWRHEFKSYQIL